jgi:hypothetical protein
MPIQVQFPYQSLGRLISIAPTGCLCHKHCDFEQMIDVGLLSRTLATMMYVPAGGGISGL